jgi:2-iminobutanoate/2-iminopropanoate deaminase
VKERIQSSEAPRPLGPYSQAVAVAGLVFCAGQGPLDPETNRIVDGGMAAQTERTLRNLGAVLEAAGLGYQDVVKTTCFLADMDDFRVFNDVYATYFAEPYPARTTIQAARLPQDMLVEIEAVAVRS